MGDILWLAVYRLWQAPTVRGIVTAVSSGKFGLNRINTMLYGSKHTKFIYKYCQILYLLLYYHYLHKEYYNIISQEEYKKKRIKLLRFQESNNNKKIKLLSVSTQTSIIHVYEAQEQYTHLTKRGLGTMNYASK